MITGTIHSIIYQAVERRVIAQVEVPGGMRDVTITTPGVLDVFKKVEQVVRTAVEGDGTLAIGPNMVVPFHAVVRQPEPEDLQAHANKTRSKRAPAPPRAR